MKGGGLLTSCGGAVVYFICALDDPDCLVKIGYTSGDADGRLAQLQPSSPVRLGLIAAVEGTRADEARLHARFARDRCRGEWFYPSPALRAFLRELLEPQLTEAARGMLADPAEVEWCARVLHWPAGQVRRGLGELVSGVTGY
jgi:hypothetical protein